MTEIKVEITGERDLVFNGELIAEDTTECGTGRKEVIKSYLTEGGLWVISKCEATQWQGERDLYTAVSTRSKEDIFAFLGYSDAAKNIYIQMGLDPSIHLE